MAGRALVCPGLAKKRLLPSRPVPFDSVGFRMVFVCIVAAHASIHSISRITLAKFRMTLRVFWSTGAQPCAGYLLGVYFTFDHESGVHVGSRMVLQCSVLADGT